MITHQDVEQIRATHEDGTTNRWQKANLVKEIFSKHDDLDCKRLLEATAESYLDAISYHGKPKTLDFNIYQKVLEAFVEHQQWGALTSNVYVWTDITGNVEATYDSQLHRQGYMLIHTWHAGFPDAELADQVMNVVVDNQELYRQLEEEDTDDFRLEWEDGRIKPYSLKDDFDQLFMDYYMEQGWLIDISRRYGPLSIEDDQAHVISPEEHWQCLAAFKKIALLHDSM